MTNETKQVDARDEVVETEHTVRIGDEDVTYTASAGRFVMRSDDGKARASIFFVAYSRHGTHDPAQRPITFCFNGGPGSSSVWLHMGLLGPRRVLGGDVDSPQRPPWQLTDNAHSLLDVTDLVFIDPVSTGYSRASDGEDARGFHGVEQDVESVGEFIRLYVSRTRRWRSPKYLIGESYGTTRAAGLAGWLQNRHGMYLNGLLLISVALDFQTLEFEAGNDLPYILFLPTYAAAAWYHGRLADLQESNLQDVLARAEDFALGPYALALLQGDRLDQTGRAATARELASLTGLSPDYVERSDLRVPGHHFVRELLRSSRLTVGRLDVRFTGAERDGVASSGSYDPSYAFVLGPYAAALNDYVRSELRFESDMAYEIMAELYERWDYGRPNRYLHLSETLRAAMSRNPGLRVYVASGIYDLATPYLAADYTLAHLGLDAAQRANVSSSTFEAGHMMYVHDPSLRRLKAEMADFVRSSSRPHTP